MPTISERHEQALKCRADFIAAKQRVKDAVATIQTQLQAIGTVTATGSALMVSDPDCGLTAAEVAEWGALVGQAETAMAGYADLINGLFNG